MATEPTLKTRRFTVDEYHRMARAGILHEDDRIELLEGEIVEMAPIGDRHAACVNDLNAAILTGLTGRAIVSVQNPVRLSLRSEPQPDLLVLRPRADHYRQGLPGPEDVLLLIEVADTTLAYDRGIKLRLYARAGIPEVWIWDLKRRRVLTFRDPAGTSYRATDTVTGGTVSPTAFPDLHITLDEILG